MPVVVVKLAKGRPASVKRKLVKTMTDVLVSVLDVQPEWVTVLLDEYERENWATAGLLHSDKYGKGFGKAAKKRK